MFKFIKNLFKPTIISKDPTKPANVVHEPEEMTDEERNNLSEKAQVLLIMYERNGYIDALDISVSEYQHYYGAWKELTDKGIIKEVNQSYYKVFKV